MMLDILVHNVSSQSVSVCTSKISIFPQFFFQTWESAKYSTSAVALDNRHDLPDRSRGGKLNLQVEVFFHDLYFQYFDVVRFAYFLNHLLRSFPDLDALEALLPVFRAPDQMITRVVDRMTRPAQRQSFTLSYRRARPMRLRGIF